MLQGITNFLKFVYENWTTIVVVVALIVALVRRIYRFFTQSWDDNIKSVIDQIKEIALKLVVDAEMDYEEWNKAGSVKRSQVIQKIYQMYPILSKVVDQSKITKLIDDIINKSLVDLHNLIADNPDKSLKELYKIIAENE